MQGTPKSVANVWTAVPSDVIMKLLTTLWSYFEEKKFGVHVKDYFPNIEH